MGIGPWRVNTFNAEIVVEQTYRGQHAEYSIKVYFARSKNVIWEIMQPLSSPTIFQEFLERHDQGIHHIASNCGDRPWNERIQLIQSGKWMEQNAFTFFDTEDATTTTVETCLFPPGFEYPEPEA